MLLKNTLLCFSSFSIFYLLTKKDPFSDHRRRIEMDIAIKWLMKLFFQEKKIYKINHSLFVR